MSKIAQANEQARELRTETERQISELLNLFETKTGLQVNGLDLVRGGTHGEYLALRLEVGLDP